MSRYCEATCFISAYDVLDLCRYMRSQSHYELRHFYIQSYLQHFINLQLLIIFKNVGISTFSIISWNLYKYRLGNLHSFARQCKWKFAWASGKQAWAGGILYRPYKRLPSLSEYQKFLFSFPACKWKSGLPGGRHKKIPDFSLTADTNFSHSCNIYHGEFLQ